MKLKLKTRILAVTGIVLLLLLAVMAVYRFAITSTTGKFDTLMKEEVALSNHAEKIKNFMTQALENENKFLLLSDSQYSARAKESVKSMLQEAEAIGNLAAQSGYEDGSQKAREIVGYAKDYLKAFEGVIVSVEAKGLDNKSGLRGKFDAIAKNLARDLQGYQVEDLYIALLQMRRYEKDYVKSESAKDKKYLLESMGNYLRLLDESKSEEKALNAQKEALGKYSKTLEDYFAKVERTKKIAQLKTVLYRRIKIQGRKMEKALENIYVPRATELLLQIRKNEKDYLLLKDKTYVDATHRSMAYLEDTIKKSGLLKEYALVVEKALSEYKKVFDALVSKDDEIASFMIQMSASVQKIVPLVAEIAKKAEETAILKTETTISEAKSYATIALVVGIAAMIIGISLALFISGGIAKNMSRIAEALNEGADQVSSASGQVSSSSQSLAEGASEQAASIEETSSSLEEMSSMTKQNADNAHQADSLMKEANQVVKQANDSMVELTTSMEEISKASEETSKIIKTIDEIAFQTNLLALNAAVEAARAGEAGAGFAVVADEVRNLAMRAADAAKNTADLIEGTVKRVTDGSGLVTKTDEAFTRVAENASKVGELVGEIAAASSEQAQGIDQVNKATVEMDKVTQQNAANAEESASASEEMKAQAGQMKGMVGELVALVDGNRVKAGGKRYDVSRERKARGVPLPVPVKESKGKELAFHGAKAVKPGEVIPLDDGDFKDF